MQRRDSLATGVDLGLRSASGGPAWSDKEGVTQLAFREPEFGIQQDRMRFGRPAGGAEGLGSLGRVSRDAGRVVEVGGVPDEGHG